MNNRNDKNESHLSRFKYCPECGGELVKENIAGRWRLRCRECGEIHYENPLPATAVVVRNGKGELLLVKRSQPPDIGKWCLPGGFVERGETVREGALRELKEETGLEGRIARLIDVKTRVNGYWGDVILIGFEVDIVGGNLRAADDASEAHWFPLEQMPEIAFDTHRHMVSLVTGVGNDEKSVQR